MSKRINLISDTVTRPSKAMLEQMFIAEVGDDVFKEDPSVNALEAKAAALFGMESALYMPSGTMANQIAIKLHTNEGQQIICDKTAHIYKYENGGIAVNSRCSVVLMEGDRGRFTATDVKNALQLNGPYYMQETGLVSIENTTNLGGGAVWDINEVKKISALCVENKIPFHMDGARLFNALVKTGTKPEQYGKLFDTISICISKGLGAPVGSILLASKKHIAKAMRIRKMMGGGMRQAGYLAAACAYALDNNVERLAIDHEHAKRIGEALKKQNYIKTVLDVQTNIVIFELKDEIDQEEFLSKLLEKNIHIVSMGGAKLRMTTHLDFSSEDLEVVLEFIEELG